MPSIFYSQFKNIPEASKATNKRLKMICSNYFLQKLLEEMMKGETLEICFKISKEIMIKNAIELTSIENNLEFNKFLGEGFIKYCIEPNEILFPIDMESGSFQDFSPLKSKIVIDKIKAPIFCNNCDIYNILSCVTQRK